MTEKHIQTNLIKLASLRGWYLLVTNSSARFNPDAGSYIASDFPAGTLDVTGCDQNGRAVFIEVKTPAKFNNLSPEQRITLMKHIHCDRFAVVCDSPDRLFLAHETWQALECPEKKKEYLISLVPPRKSNTRKRMTETRPLAF